MSIQIRIIIKTEEVEFVNKLFKDVEDLKTNCESRDLEDRIYWKNQLDKDIPELEKESLNIEKFIKNDTFDKYVEEISDTSAVLDEIKTQQLAVKEIYFTYNK